MGEKEPLNKLDCLKQDVSKLTLASSVLYILERYLRPINNVTGKEENDG